MAAKFNDDVVFLKALFAYPELYAVVGGAVPDFRGLFLRGIGGNSAGLGQAQGDAIRNITGSFNVDPHQGTSGAFRSQAVSVSSAAGNDGTAFQVILDASRVVPTANENRPVNKAVRYLIRAKP